MNGRDSRGDGLCFPALKVENGKFLIPEGFGWGIEINKKWLEKCEHRISMIS